MIIKTNEGNLIDTDSIDFLYAILDVLAERGIIDYYIAEYGREIGVQKLLLLAHLTANQFDDAEVAKELIREEPILSDDKYTRKVIETMGFVEVGEDLKILSLGDFIADRSCILKESGIFTEPREISQSLVENAKSTRAR